MCIRLLRRGTKERNSGKNTDDPKNKERKYLDKFVVKGGRRLEGEVTISGAKNAAVAILPAVILSDEPCIVENVPYISDVRICIHLDFRNTVVGKPENGENDKCDDDGRNCRQVHVVDMVEQPDLIDGRRHNRSV